MIHIVLVIAVSIKIRSILELCCSPVDSGHWARYQFPLQFGKKTPNLTTRDETRSTLDQKKNRCRYVSSKEKVKIRNILHSL